MTYASPIQTSVNSGELSPRMAARVDFDRYKNACARARNIILLPTGGFTKAPGSRFISTTYDQTKTGRLIPFKFSQEDAYVLEMSENVMRFYRHQAKVTCPDVGASITNGTFNSDISGWSDVGAGAPSWSVGRMLLGVGTDENPSAVEQSVSTSTPGVEHVVSFTIFGSTGAKVKVVVGSSSNTSNIVAETEYGVGWHTIAFTPGVSPFFLGFRSYTGEFTTLDDVVMLDNADLTLAHEYTEAQLPSLRWVQTADVLYLFHPDKPTHKLSRLDAFTWSLASVNWQDGPYDEENDGFDTTLTQLVLNANFEDGIRFWTDKTTRTGTSSEQGSYLDYDAGQHIISLISGDDFNDVTAIEQQVSTGASGSNVFVLHFQSLGSVKVQQLLHLAIGTTSGGVDILADAGYEQGWHSIKITSSQATWFIRFSFQQPAGASGEPPVTAALSSCQLYRQDSHLLELNGTTGTVTCNAYGFAPFAATDVGRIIRFTWPGKEPAWGIINFFFSTSSVQLILRRDAPYANIPTADWRFGSWSETNGYPEVGAFFQSRLVAAKTEAHPLSLWFTQTGDLENFRPDSFAAAVSTTEDDDALTYLIASEEVNAITWVAGKRKLLIGTSGGQFVASSQGAAITATDISIEPHADVPSKLAAPIATQSALVFIEESGTQVYDLGFSFEQDSFLAADVTILADHLLRKAKAEEIALQKRPIQTVWTRRDDGRLAVLGYNRSQEIIGWSHRIMGGSFSGGDPVVESIAIIPGRDDDTQVLPSGERDEVWVMVKRTINGGTKRYIEVFEQYYEGLAREEYDTEALWETAVKADMVDAFYVDAGVTYDGVATATITGLSHLEGETVKILADGKVHTPKVVAGGAVTLEYAASKVQVGLGYAWSFESLKLPFGTQAGSGVTKQKSIPAVGLVLHESGIFSYGIVTYDEEEGRRVHDPQELTFLRDGLNADEAIPLFTGEVVRNLDGATRRDVRVYLEGDDPLPFTMLALSPQMNSAER